MGNERILVTGANGLLGTKIFNLLYSDHTVVGIDISEGENSKVKLLDICDKGGLASLFKDFRPTTVIHAAAISLPDECEKKHQEAWKVNVEGTRNVADISRKYGTKMVFTSSLHVFDGKRGNYSERDKPSPINQYGRTKLAGERIVLNSSPNNLVLRLGTLYGHNAHRKDYVLEVSRKFALGVKVGGFTDLFRNYTLIDDFAPNILCLLENNISGLFHFCNFEISSVYDFLIEVAVIFGFPKTLVVSKRAKPFYPKNVTLDSTRVRKLGACFHSINEGLLVVKRQIRKEINDEK